MRQPFTVSLDGWKNGQAIPAKYALGQIPESGHFQFGGNTSPSIRWEGTPTDTKSFVIICHDPDVPSVADEVNQEGKIVPADLPRVIYYHWVLADIPAHQTNLAEGVASQGVTPRGKSSGKKPYGLAGLNDYTQWFAGDPEMGGHYADYDGPCPPSLSLHRLCSEQGEPETAGDLRSSRGDQGDGRSYPCPKLLDGDVLHESTGARLTLLLAPTQGRGLS